jgi:hypothetical protein
MTTTDVVERTPVQDVIARVRSEQFKQQVALALPSNVRPERFQRAVVTAILQNPEVVVDPDSLYNSVIRCAQDGLLPDGREAALVVFNVKGEKKVQYLPMVFGLRKKAAEHGFSLAAYVVYEHDEFDWLLGMEPTVHAQAAEARRVARRGDRRVRGRDRQAHRREVPRGDVAPARSSTSVQVSRAQRGAWAVGEVVGRRRARRSRAGCSSSCRSARSTS